MLSANGTRAEIIKLVKGLHKDVGGRIDVIGPNPKKHLFLF